MPRWVRQVAIGWVIAAPVCLAAGGPAAAQGQESSWVGTSGCSKQGCHNGPGKGKRAEYRLWSTQDPHSQAFDVLKEKISQRIAEGIGLTQPAYKADLCVRCHSADAVPWSPKPNQADRARESRLSEGVSCEVCHGAASKWLEPHLRPQWRAQTRAVKAQSGLRDLTSPRARVEICINCHVGMPGFEVNHDMIAAGHPRLRFEVTAFLDTGLTRHWDETEMRRRDPAFTAKLWFMGQTATFKRDVAVLAARTPEQLFTEFADHDCYACHKSLARRSFTKPLEETSLTWGRWPAELTLLAQKRTLGLPQGTVADVAQIRDRLQLTTFDHSALDFHALTEKFAAWDKFADQAQWPAADLRAMMLDCASPVAAGNSEWEVAWQRYRAISALGQSLNGGREVQGTKLGPPLADLRAILKFRDGFASPVGFELETFNRQMEVVRKTLEAQP